MSHVIPNTTINKEIIFINFFSLFLLGLLLGAYNDTTRRLHYKNGGTFHLDHNILKNCRPVSNLSFLSKIIERVVAKQLTDYMSKHDLHESYQSAYKQFHSTETALIKVDNDIMWAMERQCVTILVLLDLSSAFDTIDHQILLKRLCDMIAIQDIPLSWLKSYPTDKSSAF